MQYQPDIVLKPGDPYTITRKILEDQKKYSEAIGDFTILVQSIVTACKFISSKVRKAGIAGLYGNQSDAKNATGDTQKKIDVLSNEVFINT
jgi:fructose-1,6-bisphosphatase I